MLPQQFISFGGGHIVSFDPKGFQHRLPFSFLKVVDLLGRKVRVNEGYIGMNHIIGLPQSPKDRTRSIIVGLQHPHEAAKIGSILDVCWLA